MVVFVYTNKENLPIKERRDLETLDETIVAEIKMKRKKIFFVLSYRHPNQSRFTKHLRKKRKKLYYGWL